MLLLWLSFDDAVVVIGAAEYMAAARQLTQSGGMIGGQLI